VRGLFFTLSGNLSSSKRQLMAAKKAQKAQSEKDGVETVVTHSVKVSVSAKTFLLLCFLRFFAADCFFSVHSPVNLSRASPSVTDPWNRDEAPCCLGGPQCGLGQGEW